MHYLPLQNYFQSAVSEHRCHQHASQLTSELHQGWKGYNSCLLQNVTQLYNHISSCEDRQALTQIMPTNYQW